MLVMMLRTRVWMRMTRSARHAIKRFVIVQNPAGFTVQVNSVLVGVELESTRCGPALGTRIFPARLDDLCFLVGAKVGLVNLGFAAMLKVHQGRRCVQFQDLVKNLAEKNLPRYFD